MRLEAACEPKFARHETFHPRYGWVKKAFDASLLNPPSFEQEDAVLKLGVGKNMVKSIRFWGEAFGVLRNVPIEGSRVTTARPTEFGQLLFADDGWDPYSELVGTPWILHWRLNAPGSVLPVWWLAMNEFSAVEFTPEEFEQFVVDRCRDFGSPKQTAVHKDVQCMLRMYSSGQSVRATFDDLVDCPFRDLNLMRPSPSEPGAYRFEIGPKPTLSASILAFACLDFVARADSSARVINISRLATEHGAPGRVFKLPETEIVRLLELAARESNDFDVTSSAGAVQIAFTDEPSEIATKLLHAQFCKSTSDAALPDGLSASGPQADQIWTPKTEQAQVA